MCDDVLDVKTAVLEKLGEMESVLPSKVAEAVLESVTVEGAQPLTKELVTNIVATQCEHVLSQLQSKFSELSSRKRRRGADESEKELEEDLTKMQGSVSHVCKFVSFYYLLRYVYI